MIDKKLPLRIGVGVIVLDNKNKVFVGKRKDNPGDKWQMPQGGVDNGEDFITAMRRELHEETSIKNIKVIKEINQLYEYELPKNLIGIILKGGGAKSAIYPSAKKHTDPRPGQVEFGSASPKRRRFGA